MSELKTVLHRYLQETRDALVGKLDGLGERDSRLPRTATGTNLLGIVKHCLNVEAVYFGPTFGREFPAPDLLVSYDLGDSDPQVDWFADEHETKDQILDTYRQVWAFADETLDLLPLDAPGRVAWWPQQRADVTLQQILVHVTADLTRHAGQADILREQLDSTVGWRTAGDNIPDYDWPAYVAKLTALADRFA